MKRVLVSATLDTGDDVSASVRVENGNFTSKDRDSLLKKVNQVIKPVSDDALYFKIKYTEKIGKSKGNTDSFKVSSFSDINSKVCEVFSNLGV